MDHIQKKCESLFFRRETYYLCQTYFDSYLALKTLSEDELQLLATTCLHIAWKIEEVEPVNIKEVISASEKRPQKFNEE